MDWNCNCLVNRIQPSKYQEPRTTEERQPCAEREGDNEREREIKERERQGRTLEVGVYRERINTNISSVHRTFYFEEKINILYLTFI